MLYRRATVISVALLIAVLLSYYVGYAQYYWLPLSTFFVMQTSHRFQLRQSLQLTAVMIIGVSLSMVFYFYPILGVIFPVVFFVVFTYVYSVSYRPITFYRQMLILFPLIIILAAFRSHAMTDVKYRCSSILMGAAIGFVMTRCFKPFDVVKTFKADLLPVLIDLSNYIERLANEWVESEMFPAKNETSIGLPMIKSLSHHYPEWIYFPGFNPALRSGMRYFLIHLERVSETLFSLDSLIKKPVEKTYWEPLKKPFSDALQRNKELLRIVAAYFEQESPSYAQENYTQDIVTLEEMLKERFKTQHEIMDMASHELILAAVMREIKDMRMVLLQLTLVTQKAMESH